MAGGEVVLKAEGISKKFGGITALNQASLELRRGEAHALVGANGAGKSTLIKIITGAYAKDAGKIFLDGKETDIKSTFEARNLGISAVYQEFSLINTVSVAENIYMGKFLKKNLGPIQKIDWKKINSETQKLLDELQVKNIKPSTIVGTLSVAEKQMVEIAKALSNKAKILIMDEPSASLTDNEIENMFRIVKKLKSEGISIVYVSHRLEEIPKICDRVSVYRDGEYIKTLNIEDAPKSVIIENMVGKKISETVRAEAVSKETLLEVRNFTSGKKFQNINLTLHKGEILGICGLAGAGRTEFVRALFGVDKKDSGEIFIGGKNVKIHSPEEAKKYGLGFITENRKEEGLLLNMNLHTNVGMSILKQLQHGLKMDKKKELDITDHYLKELSVKCSGAGQKARALSGGNQQKVVIAKWLATNPRILIMDEPTRGIDIGAKNQIYALINSLAEQGIGIIMISSELSEIIQMSNTIVVFSAGRVTGIMENSRQITQDLLLDFATSDKASNA